MSVSVDTVYRTVLLILNKEQRGYMTPDEFNKIGSQVQREIFERYFEDINQQVRIQQTEYDYANRVYNTDEKIAEFKTTALATHTSNGVFDMPSDLYRLGSLTYTPTNVYPVELQRLERNEFYNINKSPLTRPTTSCPIYLYEDNKAIVYPTTISGRIEAQYVKKPEDIRWGYTIGDLGQYLYTDYPYVATAINIGNITSSIVTDTIASATDGTYANATYSGGSGTGAVFSVSITSGAVDSISVTSQGSGYAAGDLIGFPASQFGGSTTGDLEIRLTSDNLFSGSQQGYIDFGLHNSEQSEIVLNVLMYAGIVIRDPQIVQTAMAQIQKEEVNEKQ
jgi:hypothetical protein